MDDARTGWLSKFFRLAPAALLAVPIVWAVIACARGSAPRPMAAPPRRPALVFAQRLVDLGLTAPSQEVFAHYDFMNRGSEPVTITELVPSCGCLNPELRKRTYYPGEQGHFFLRVQTANEIPGPREYTVEVKYEDPEPQNVLITFRVTLPDNKVSINPPAFVVQSMGSNEPVTREIEIVDRRSEPLSIDRIDCTRSHLLAIGPVTTELDENGYTRFRFPVTVPGDLPEGRTEAVIRVVTKDHDYRVLRVPVRVINLSAPPLDARKRRVIDPNLRPASAEEDE
jgi:hypothetical protein